MLLSLLVSRWSENIDMPFCFCWANENWSKNWDGGNREIIMEQNYGSKEDWELHFQYLLKFFKDKRYITIDGRPLFIIYKPEQIVDIYQMTLYMRKRAKEEGFPDLCLAFQFPSYYADMYYREDVFDYRIEFEPVYSRNINSMKRPGTNQKVTMARKIFGEDILSVYRKKRMNKTRSAWPKSQSLGMFFYDEMWKIILNAKWEKDFLPGCFVDWDNTPRNKHGVMFTGFSIEKFSSCMKQIVQRANKEKKPLLFINAWNEWGEGAFLEPDEKYGYKKLEAIQKALEASWKDNVL